MLLSLLLLVKQALQIVKYKHFNPKPEHSNNGLGPLIPDWTDSGNAILKGVYDVSSSEDAA